MTTSQKRAIYYSLMEKKRNKARQQLKEVKELTGVDIEPSTYPEVTLRRIKNFMKRLLEAENDD